MGRGPAPGQGAAWVAEMRLLQNGGLQGHQGHQALCGQDSGAVRAGAQGLGEGGEEPHVKLAQASSTLGPRNRRDLCAHQHVGTDLHTVCKIRGLDEDWKPRVASHL